MAHYAAAHIIACFTTNFKVDVLLFKIYNIRGPLKEAIVSKQVVSNVSSVGIIVRATDPSQIFIEAKDDGHPIKLERRALCPIGGNWIGAAAKADVNPFATFRREINEEMCLEKPAVSTIELRLLGLQADGEFTYRAPTNGALVEPEDKYDLAEIKAQIIESANPFGSFLNTVTKEAMQSADPGCQKDGFTTLCNYFAVCLSEPPWEKLARLQAKFGNLSNESLTLLTSVSEIVELGTRGAFAHERVLQQFFLTNGITAATEMVLTPNQSSVYAGPVLDSYAELLEHYDVLKRP
jgi:hypothetical protein